MWAEAAPRAVRTEADGYFVTVFVSQLLAGAVQTLPVKGDLSRKVLLGAATIGDAGKVLRRRAAGLVGPAASPIGSSKPAWTRLLADCAKTFPKLPFLGFAPFYYDTMEPALRGLEAVGGDLSDGGRRYRAALAGLEPRPADGPRAARHAPPGDRAELPPSRRGRREGAPNDPDSADPSTTPTAAGSGRVSRCQAGPRPHVERGTLRPGPADQPLSDQVKRVRFSAGARPPGRRPFRTSKVG